MVNVKMREVWIISGIPSVGKTTTSFALANKLEKSSVISGDDLQDQIVSGSVGPTELPKEDSDMQIELTVRNQAILAKSYADSGFTPVCDNVFGRRQLGIFLNLLKGYQVHLVNLTADFTVIQDRNMKRILEEKFDNPDRWTLLFTLTSELSGIGLWIDNSLRTPEETVDHILNYKNDAMISFAKGELI